MSIELIPFGAGFGPLNESRLGGWLRKKSATQQVVLDGVPIGFLVPPDEVYRTWTAYVLADYGNARPTAKGSTNDLVRVLVRHHNALEAAREALLLHPADPQALDGTIEG